MTKRLRLKRPPIRHPDRSVAPSRPSRRWVDHLKRFSTKATRGRSRRRRCGHDVLGQLLRGGGGSGSSALDVAACFHDLTSNVVLGKSLALDPRYSAPSPMMSLRKSGSSSLARSNRGRFSNSPRPSLLTCSRACSSSSESLASARILCLIEPGSATSECDHLGDRTIVGDAGLHELGSGPQTSPTTRREELPS